jgi:hypothetical protein
VQGATEKQLIVKASFFWNLKGEGHAVTHSTANCRTLTCLSLFQLAAQIAHSLPLPTASPCFNWKHRYLDVTEFQELLDLPTSALLYTLILMFSQFCNKVFELIVTLVIPLFSASASIFLKHCYTIFLCEEKLKVHGL